MGTNASASSRARTLLSRNQLIRRPARTSSVRTSQSNTSGIVFVRNLPVGGPYTVKASSVSYADQTVTDVDLRLGDTFTMIVQLGSSTMEEVIVTAAMVQT